MTPMSPRLLRPRASGGFDPRSISNLAAWYDAADSSSVTLNGSNVSQLSDKSGNGRNAAQGAAGSQPAYSTAKYNGKNVVTHTANRTLGVSVPFITTVSMFVVATKGSGGGQFILVSTGSGSAPTFITGFIGDYEYYNPTNDRTLMAAAGTATGLNVLAFTHTDSATLRVYYNGSQIASKTAQQSYNGQSLTTLGSSGYGGDIAEVLIYQRVLSDSERSAVTSYLGTKWGVTVT